jgi:ribosomal protein L7Ae-like RNA K-turn-binding protein
MPTRKKHYHREMELPAVDPVQKITALLQFARKAGQLVHGAEACKKNVASGKIKLLLLTKDISDNTRDRIMRITQEQERPVPVREFGTQQELSAALGLPWTAVIGVLDKNFAGKILSYFEL